MSDVAASQCTFCAFRAPGSDGQSGCSRKNGLGGVTYEWYTAVCAPANLRLVYVDEDTGVAERTAASVARGRSGL